MNVFSGDMQLAMAHDRINRLRAEADQHRLSAMARPDGPRPLERLGRSLNQGLRAVAESFTSDPRPRIPAI